MLSFPVILGGCDSESDQLRTPGIYIQYWSTNKIQLTINDYYPAECNGYLLERKRAADTMYLLLDTLLPGTHTYTDIGLIENTTYSYRIRKYRGSEYSDYSAERTCTTLYLNDFWQTTGLFEAEVEAVKRYRDSTIFVGSSYLWISTDLGASWFFPSDPHQIIWVQDICHASEHYVFASSGNGVYRSADVGIHWEKMAGGMEQKSVRTFTIKQGGQLFVGSNDGIYRSTDNGSCWHQVFGTLFFGIRELFADSRGYVYSLDMLDWMYYSTNSGNNWMFSAPSNNIQLLGAGSPGVLLGAANNKGGIKISTDNGKNWYASGLTNEAIISMLGLPSGDVFAGTGDHGVFQSPDNGSTWTPLGLENIIVQAFEVDQNGYLYAGTKNSGLLRSKHPVVKRMK